MTDVDMLHSPVSPEGLIEKDIHSFSHEASNLVMRLEYLPSKAYQELPTASSAPNTPNSLPLRPHMRARGEQPSSDASMKARQAQKTIYDYFGTVSKAKEAEKVKQPEEVSKKIEQPPPALFNEWKAPQYKEPHCTIHQNVVTTKAKTSGQRNRETFERARGTISKPANGFEHAQSSNVRSSILPGFKPDLSTASLTYLPASMSPRITDVVDHSLVPKPLRSNSPSGLDNVCFELEDTHTECLMNRPPRTDCKYASDMKEVTSAPRDIPPPIYQPINTPRKTIQPTPSPSVLVQKPKPQPSRHAPLRSKLSLTTLPPTPESPLSFTVSSASSSPTFLPRSPTFHSQVPDSNPLHLSHSTSSTSAEKPTKKWYSKRKQKPTTPQGDKERKKFRKEEILVLPANPTPPPPAPTSTPILYPQDPTAAPSADGSPSEDDHIALMDLPYADRPPKKPGKLVRLFENYSRHVEGLQMIQ